MVHRDHDSPRRSSFYDTHTSTHDEKEGRKTVQRGDARPVDLDVPVIVSPILSDTSLPRRVCARVCACAPASALCRCRARLRGLRQVCRELVRGLPRNVLLLYRVSEGALVAAQDRVQGGGVLRRNFPPSPPPLPSRVCVCVCVCSRFLCVCVCTTPF